MSTLQAPNFARMSRSERRDYILSEEHAANQVNVTASPENIGELLFALDKTSKHKLSSIYSAASSLRIIDDNWGIDMSTFPSPHHGRDFRPPGDASSWNVRLLATIAILSEFTPNQGENMGELLCYGVEARVGNGRSKQELRLKDIDVKRVIRDTLRQVGDMAEEEDVVMARKRKAGYDTRNKTIKKARMNGGDPEGMYDALDAIAVDDVGKEMEHVDFGV